MINNTNTKVGLVDDHRLMRQGIAELISNFEGFEVCLLADNGIDLIKQLSRLKKAELPTILLMDIEMDAMDGYDVTSWLKGNIRNKNILKPYEYREVYNEIKVAGLSMNSQEVSIIRLLNSGATGYIFKDADPHELLDGLKDMRDKGYYYSENANKVILSNLKNERFVPNEQQCKFIKLASTELTYMQIADKMFLSKRRIDGIREQLFIELNLKNRVGLVLYGIRNGIVTVKK